MSMMLCAYCDAGGYVDTDADPDSLYVLKDAAVCCMCRFERDIEPNYELYA